MNKSGFNPNVELPFIWKTIYGGIFEKNSTGREGLSCIIYCGENFHPLIKVLDAISSMSKYGASPCFWKVFYACFGKFWSILLRESRKKLGEKIVMDKISHHIYA